MLESDSQAVINMLHGQSVEGHELGVILHDIKGLGLRFQCCVFYFVRRTANLVAHVLASKSVVGLGSLLWTDCRCGYLGPY